MKRISKISAKRSAREILLVLTLASLISMTGCAQRYLVVKGDEMVSVKKSDLDNLHTDNENLLKALEECRGGR
jgi:hypothetical protein